MKQGKPRKTLKSLHVLFGVGMLCLSACVQTKCEDINTRPPFPIAGQAVAKELETLDPNDFPALEEWLGRLDKLNEQLGQAYE
jgi:hypothetical protein